MKKISIGNTAIVPKWEWINIVNLEPIRQSLGSDIQIAYDASYAIEYGGRVKVIGIDNDRLLVEYKAPASSCGPVICPSGALFFITKEKFSKMTAEFKQIRAREKQEKNTVERLLAKK